MREMPAPDERHQQYLKVQDLASSPAVWRDKGRGEGGGVPVSCGDELGQIECVATVELYASGGSQTTFFLFGY